MAGPVRLPVVCAVIERPGAVLVAQRPPHKHLPLQWEFPGGKVEADETPEAALRREIFEELSCTLADLVPLTVTEHDYGAVRIRMTAFVASLEAGSPEPSPREHVAVRWLSPDDLRRVELAAADQPVVQAYLQRRTAR